MSSSTLTIRQLGTEQHWITQWDDFVLHHPDATFFHRAGWRTVLQQAFGHRSYFLFAEVAGVIVGILPLGEIRSRLFGHSLISTPFCVYGGVIANDEIIAERLETEAILLAETLQVDQLELRQRQRQHPQWPHKTLYVTFRKPILPTVEDNLLAIPRKQRAMVRKGIQAGLTSRIDVDSDLIYGIYSESLRNLGTPVFAKTYFRILKQVFGQDCETVAIYDAQQQLIAGVLNFYFRDEVLPYYGGGSAHARALKANDFMYWEVMRRACERGCQIFDYGRSKVGTGSYDFKCNWGFTPEPLHYEFKLVRAHHIPDHNPLNPKYRLFIQGWRRLPLAVSRFLGPWLARNLG
jgi:FemAB-related protein (PEP-CTERM system-associated)